MVCLLAGETRSHEENNGSHCHEELTGPIDDICPSKTMSLACLDKGIHPVDKGQDDQ